MGDRERCGEAYAFSGSRCARGGMATSWLGRWELREVRELRELWWWWWAEETLLAGLGGEGVAGESGPGWEMTESWARLLLLPLLPRWVRGL